MESKAKPNRTVAARRSERQSITRAEALAYERRWRLVNRITMKEARQTSMEQRLRTLAELMAWARAIQPLKEEVRDTTVHKQTRNRTRGRRGGRS